MASKELFDCPICNRKHPQQKMSWHHLYPTTTSKEKDEPRIYICQTCHTVIHYCHPNDVLRELYNTLEKILKSTKIINMVNLYKYKANDKIYKIKKLKQLMKESNHDNRISNQNRSIAA